MLTNQRFARPTALFISLVTLAFLFMTFDVRTDGAGIVGTLRDGARSLFNPVQSAVNAVVRPIDDAVDTVINYTGLRRENEALREQLDEANRILAETESIRIENQVLSELLVLELPGELLERSVVARVEAGGSSNFDLSVVLSKGSDDGLAVGQPVVNLQGLVGRLDSVTQSTATVKLLTDPDLSVAAQLVSTGLVGIAEGRGSSDLKFVSSRATDPIEAGELVVTFANRFPAGLVIGTVSQAAQPAAGAGIQTTVEPAVDFNRLDFVRVILFLPGTDDPGSEDDEAPIELEPAS